MITGYELVYTKGQATSGNLFEEQEIKLMERGCSKVYRESYTGTKLDRPVFKNILKWLQAPLAIP